MEECNIDFLRKAYRVLEKKYKLPEFDLLNRDFQIEKIADSETEYLLREIRKMISAVLTNYLRFVEIVLHPVNVPMFIFSIVKSLGKDELSRFKEIYKKLARKEIELIRLDLTYDEKGEVDFIKDSCKIWQGVKKDILDVIKTIEKNWDNKIELNGKGNNYFG